VTWSLLNMSSMVALPEALAHPCRPTLRLLKIAEGWADEVPNEASPSPAYRTLRRLRPDELDDIVVAYASGATVEELAAKYNVHRITIGKQLRKRGIQTAAPRVRPEYVCEAVQLYEAGSTLVQIAARFGVGRNTIRLHLIASGVQMRKKGRRGGVA